MPERFLEITADAVRAIADEIDADTRTVILVDHPEGSRYVALLTRVRHEESQPRAYHDERGFVDPTEDDLRRLAEAAESQGVEWPPEPGDNDAE